MHDPEADEGFVGAALSSTLWRFHRANGAYAAEPVIAVEPVDLDGWPIPVPGLITDLVLSMDDKAPLLLQLAARRPAPLRRLRPGFPAADRSPLARRRARQAERRGPPAHGRAADAAALLRRAAALRHQLAALELGRPVLPRAALVLAQGGHRRRRLAWRSTRTSSSTSTTARTAQRGRTRCGSRAATRPRRSSRDPRTPRRRGTAAPGGTCDRRLAVDHARPVPGRALPARQAAPSRTAQRQRNPR